MTKPFHIRILLLAILLLVAGLSAHAQTGIYTVTAQELNIRRGPGKDYSVAGTLHKGETVEVVSLNNDGWAKVRIGSQEYYVSRQYISYQRPSPQSQKAASGKKHRGVWDSLYGIVEAILWLCAIVIIIAGALHSDWSSRAFQLQLVTGLGALAGWLIFSNGKAGAVIGMGFGFILFARQVVDDWDIDVNGLGWLTYFLWYVVSFPFYILDLLQFWLAKPWRPLMKRNSLLDKAKPGWRKFLRILQFPFYLALFPLRLVNAVYYNIIIHNIYELSNYVIEVAAPSDNEEGARSFWEWLLYLPLRIGKYLIYHGFLTAVESIVWTVIDTFVPAVTLYHGTAETCADSMLCDPKRNKERKRSSGWLSGIWNVGGGNYAGDGIYFGIFRKTLRNYQNGSAIVARVSTGKSIDVILMPDSVYDQAGHPNASAVSNWGLNHGYISGEWWRSDRGTNWWEICMYDRQNRYNDSWRIRPIYAINSDTGIMQRVPGGTAHWLFRRMVLRDLGTSIRNIFR